MFEILDDTIGGFSFDAYMNVKPGVALAIRIFCCVIQCIPAPFG